MGKLIRSVAFLGGAPKRSSSTLSEASKLTWHSRHPSSAAELRGHDLKHQSSVSYETSSSSEDSELSRSSLSQQKSSLKDSSPRVKTRVALPDGNGSVKKLKRALGCPRKPLALKVATLAGVQESPSSILPPPTSFGSLSKFPKEIRQALYSNVLEVEYPVTARKCRSLRISEREHSRHVKHSDSQEDAGRFNVLLVSKQIYAEASWVLYNHARLHLHIDRSVAPYFAGYNLKTLHRLGSIPRDEKVKNMWKCLAKFRFVEMEVPQTELSEGNPMVYTGRLAEAASLLLKSWENDNDQPTSIVAHTVTIKLGSLFSQIIPFNAYPTLDPFDDIYNRVYRSFPTLDVDFRQIEDECAANLRKLVAIIGSNRGSTNWSTIAFEELHKSKKGGIRQLKAFKAICTKNDIRFEGETVG